MLTASPAGAAAGSSAAAATSALEGASPFRSMSGAGDDDDAGSDSGQLFSTDSLAAAAASLAAHQQQQHAEGEQEQGAGRLGDKVTGSSGEESAATGTQVAGLWVAGDSQVTRLALQWTPSTSSDHEPPVALTQEVSEHCCPGGGRDVGWGKCCCLQTRTLCQFCRCIAPRMISRAAVQGLPLGAQIAASKQAPPKAATERV